VRVVLVVNLHFSIDLYDFRNAVVALVLSQFKFLNLASVLSVIGSIKPIVSLFKFAPQATLHKLIDDLAA
jgi:hypothetical protein